MQKQPPASEKPDIAAWFQTYSDELHRDPYPFYSYLLEHEPLCCVEERGFWVASRYDDVNRILKDPSFVREYRNAMPQLQFLHHQPAPPSEWDPVNALLANWMLLRDAPAHTRLRGLVSPAFMPRTIARLQTNIRGIAEQLADRMAEEPQPDLIASYAFPLPVIVIAELLGVPQEDRGRFREWSHTFADILESGDKPPEFAQQAGRVAEEMSEYFSRLIAERRFDPREDMISELLSAQAEADALTEQELIATCVLLLVAGHETTVNLIGNAVRLLLTCPEQHERLYGRPEHERPEWTASAVEEVLRYESPVQMTSRFASADCVVGGQTVRQGQAVMLMLGAANRDPAQFERPERFDIGRSPNRHLAFAAGAHFCLGAPLARMEGEIALSVLRERFPHMALADDGPDWRPNMLFRGLQTLSVRL